MKFSVLNKIISLVPTAIISLSKLASNIHNPETGGELYIKAAKIVDRIRATTDENTQRELKQLLPAISPGVVFGKNRQDIISYSGLMQIDIDHVSNPEQLRNELGKLSWVTLSALSVRKGVWLLVKIPDPERQAEYWAKVNDWLWNKYGVVADPARKNPKDLRFFSPDSEAIYNPSAIFLPALPAIIISKSASTFNKPKKCFTGPYFSPIDDFNANADVLQMLQSHGWKIHKQNGSNIQLTRPGKRTGISANWNESLRKLYVFTSNSELIQNETQYALSPTDIFMQLNNVTCIGIARERLINKGYGQTNK